SPSAAGPVHRKVPSASFVPSALSFDSSLGVGAVAGGALGMSPLVWLATARAATSNTAGAAVRRMIGRRGMADMAVLGPVADGDAGSSAFPLSIPKPLSRFDPTGRKRGIPARHY